ncbi:MULTISPECIES: hypothetical protein [Burkholderia]|uniref:hypothetical protein n=1 Tax=Burkholderia TaxID=32008 RepID=UPI001E52A603|nr:MULTISPECIES: hypothetical protein [unclassified Burkholderia]UEP26603.1 hypothetical protein LMA01_09765 [Burkholderia sp. B21-007]UEP40150.1 hypothetical protein LMA02_09830 [Burkholderia sp. B21-005]
MKTTVYAPISVLALMLAAPACASTPADNIAWSTGPAQTVASSSVCSAYLGRVISSGDRMTTETVLKAVGRALAGTAPPLVIGAHQGAAPNPCARPGL